MLAADEQVAAGLLLQRLPEQGSAGDEDGYQRLSILARSLKRDELLGLDADTILRRLFWQEQLLRFAPQSGADGPRFACPCSRERVAAMLGGLGQQEVQSIIDEQGLVEVGCEFCGRQERFDAVDAARLFTPAAQQPPWPESVQ
jgi:molecular chaperone Hsp33